MCECLTHEFERKGRAVLCKGCNRFLYKIDEQAYNTAIKIVTRNILDGNIDRSKSVDQLLSEYWEHSDSKEELEEWLHRSVIKTN